MACHGRRESQIVSVTVTAHRPSTRALGGRVWPSAVKPDARYPIAIIRHRMSRGGSPTPLLVVTRTISAVRRDHSRWRPALPRSPHLLVAPVSGAGRSRALSLVNGICLRTTFRSLWSFLGTAMKRLLQSAAVGAIASCRLPWSAEMTGHKQRRLGRWHQSSPHSLRALTNTSSSIASVSRPVCVFCWLG